MRKASNLLSACLSAAAVAADSPALPISAGSAAMGVSGGAVEPSCCVALRTPGVLMDVLTFGRPECWIFIEKGQGCGF